MNRPPQRFLQRLRKLEGPFTTKEVEDLFPDMKSSSISVYLSHAKNAGLIEQVGFKRFRPTERPTQAPRLPPAVAAVVDSLHGRLLPSAFEELVVWSDEDLASFVHDVIMDPFVVVEGSRKTLENVQDLLDPSFWITRARSRRELGKRLWEQERKRFSETEVVLLQNATLHATRPSPHGFQAPTLGHLLVSVLNLPALLPDTALRIMEQPGFDPQDALAVTASKQAAAQLGAFMVRAANRHPNHPVAQHAQRMMPKDLEMW